MMKKYLKHSDLPELQIDPENSIAQFKNFFNRYLITVKNRPQAIKKLNELRLKFKEKKPISFLPTSLAIALEDEVLTTLNKYFSKDVVELFKQTQKIPHKSGVDNRFQTSFWKDLLMSMYEMQMQMKADWEHRVNILNLLYFCLMEYGLHKDILKRDPERFKRFNILIQHFHRSDTPVTAYKHYLTHQELQEQFINHYKKRKPLKFKGLMIPFDKIHEVKISTTLLLSDEISLYALKHGFKWNEKEQDICGFINNCDDETEEFLPYPYDDEENSGVLNTILIAEAIDALENHQDSLRMYNSALKKLRSGIFERNALDDLRLSLEILLKNLLKNSKSLENQITEVGALLKKRKASVEITNMFVKLVDCYSKYQNNYIKHNDKVNKDEIEFILDLTSSFLKFIASK